MAEPLDKKRYGQVSATIWKNEREKNGNKFYVYDITIERNYKDKDDNWATTSKFQKNDLFAVNRLTEWAFDRVETDKQSN